MDSIKTVDPMSERLADLLKRAKPDNARAIFDILVVGYGRILATYALFLLCPNPLTFVIAFFFITSGMGVLVALSHESQHGSLLSNKRLNNIVGAWLCAYPVGSIWGASRAVHLAHHKHLNSKDDPDRHFHSEDDKSEPGQFVRHFAKMLFGGQLWTSIVVNGLQKRGTPVAEDNQTSRAGVVQYPQHKIPEILNLVPVQIVVFSIFFLTSGKWWLYFALWLLPIFTLGTLLGYLRGFIDHARLTEDKDGEDARLISVPKPSALDRWTVTGMDFHFHGEHHLFPYVPHHHLPELHEILREHPEYRDRVIYRDSYWEFLSDYWKQISSANASAGVNTSNENTAASR